MPRGPVTREPGRFPVAASVARVLLADAYADAAVDTVQLHGGIGFTWEHDAHLYYKNGLSNKVLLGGARRAARPASGRARHLTWCAGLPLVACP